VTFITPTPSKLPPAGNFTRARLGKGTVGTSISCSERRALKWQRQFSQCWPSKLRACQEEMENAALLDDSFMTLGTFNTRTGSSVRIRIDDVNLRASW